MQVSNRKFLYNAYAVTFGLQNGRICVIMLLILLFGGLNDVK